MDTIKHMGRDEFAQALKKGLGRALLHVMNQGLDDVADLVLYACIHDQSYDPQCEPSRAAWLFRMFAKSSQYLRFSDAILRGLNTETNTWNLQQLCELAREMAVHGDDVARRALHGTVRDKASRTSDDDWVGVDSWIELQGIDGMLELAEIYGNRLLLNPDDHVPDSIPLLPKVEVEFLAVLAQRASSEPALKGYRDYLEAMRVLRPPSPALDRDAAKQKRRDEFRQQHSLESILQDAMKQVGEYPSRYVQFGKYATPSELERVYAHLIAATDAAVRLRLLWVFRRAPLPELTETLFEWANGMDDALRAAAITALAQRTDQRIHELAKSIVCTPNRLSADSESLQLFLMNYEADDAILIEQALIAVSPSPEGDHSLGFRAYFSLVSRRSRNGRNTLHSPTRSPNAARR